MSDNIHGVSAHGEPSGHDQLAHVTPIWLLLAIFLTLIGLTFLTVAVTWVDLGNWNLAAAIIIATVKATLVALFFMHLANERGFNAVAFLTAIVFLGLFILLTLLDTTEYQPSIRTFEENQAAAGL